MTMLCARARQKVLSGSSPYQSRGAIISGPCEPHLLEQCPQNGAGVRMIPPLVPASLQSPILTCVAAHGQKRHLGHDQSIATEAGIGPREGSPSAQ